MDNNVNTPLVSIVVPCYNVENKIERLLKSLLVQTYKHLQVIFVNDGSQDNTLDVLNKYKKSLEKEGYEVDIISKENGGPGSAINRGLKEIKGDFFCWPDADDYLTADSIEKRLRFLLSHPDYALVRSDAALFLESDLSKPIGTITRKSKYRFKEIDLFEDYILENHAILCPGCHLARTAAFKKMSPDMDIFEGRGGQNHQLLLPLLYKNKSGYIDECLYNYIIYKDSMTQRYKSFNDHVGKCAEGELYITETLKRMNLEPKKYNYYVELTKQKYIARRALLAFDYGLREEFINERKKIKDPRFLKSLEKADLFYKFPVLFCGHHLIFKLKNWCKGNPKLYAYLKRKVK